MKFKMTKVEKCNEEKCVVCDSYEVLVSLLADGATLEEALDFVLDGVVEEFIESEESAYERGLHEGFSNGYISALEGLQEISELTINKIKGDKQCDCDGCCEGE